MIFALFRSLAFRRPPFACAFGWVLAILAVAAPARAESVSHCARFGADYVAVSGSNGCVRLGGHVRVDIARTPMGYAAQDGVRAAAARTSHVEPLAPFGLNDLFPR